MKERTELQRLFLEYTEKEVLERLQHGGLIDEKLEIEKVVRFWNAVKDGAVIMPDVMEGLPEFINQWDLARTEQQVPLIYIDSMEPMRDKMIDALEKNEVPVRVLSTRASAPSLALSGISRRMMDTSPSVATLPRSSRVAIVDSGTSLPQGLLKALQATEPKSYEEFANNREGRRAKAAVERRRNKKRGKR